VVIGVANGDPNRLIEPPACGEHFGHPRLNLRCDVVFPTCADCHVQDFAFYLRVPPGDRLHLALDLLDSAARDVAGDQLAAELALALPFDLLVLTGRRLRANEVFFSLGAVPILLRQLRLVERAQEFLLAFELRTRPLVEEVIERPAEASALSHLCDRHARPPVSYASQIAATRKVAPQTPG
jgi:hypothetical protein